MSQHIPWFQLCFSIPTSTRTHAHTHGHAHFYTVISPAESALKYQPYAVPHSPGLSTIQVNSTLVEQNTPPVTATFGGSTPPVSSSPAPDRRITSGEHSITPSDMWGEHTRYCIAEISSHENFLLTKSWGSWATDLKIDPFFCRNIAEIICSPWSIHLFSPQLWMDPQSYM